MLHVFTIILLLLTTLQTPVWAGKPTAKTSPELHQADFLAKGSRCVTCLRKLERTLRKTEGVLQAAVSIARKGETTVIYDAKKTSLEKITRRVEKEPFKVLDMKDKKIEKLPKTPVYARRDGSEPGATKDSMIPSFNQLK